MRQITVMKLLLVCWVVGNAAGATLGFLPGGSKLLGALRTRTSLTAAVSLGWMQTQDSEDGIPINQPHDEVTYRMRCGGGP